MDSKQTSMRSVVPYHSMHYCISCYILVRNVGKYMQTKWMLLLFHFSQRKPSLKTYFRKGSLSFWNMLIYDTQDVSRFTHNRYSHIHQLESDSSINYMLRNTLVNKKVDSHEWCLIGFITIWRISIYSSINSLQREAVFNEIPISYMIPGFFVKQIVWAAVFIKGIYIAGKTLFEVKKYKGNL